MEHKRPIEKLLRRFAKRRREDAGEPLELHPATRRMLQGEVARQFKQSTGAAKSLPGGWLGRIWPKLVWAVPMVAITLFGVWMIHQSQRAETEQLAATYKLPGTVPGEEETLLVKRADEADEMEAASRMMADTSPASRPTSPQPSPASKVRSEELRPVDSAPARQAARAPSLPTAPPRTVAPESAKGEVSSQQLKPAPLKYADSMSSEAESGSLGAAGRDDRDTGAGLARRTVNTATFEPAAQARALTTVTSMNSGRGSDGVSTAKTMSPSYGATSLGKSVPPVLLNFRWEQQGQRLRVVDEDGSAYTGTVSFVALKEKEAADKNVAAVGVPTGVGGKSNDASPENAWYFQVSGTNRTINEPVVFTGNLAGAENTQLNWQFSNAWAKGQMNERYFQLIATNQLPPGSSATIEGRARVGSAQEVEVRAFRIRE